VTLSGLRARPVSRVHAYSANAPSHLFNHPPVGLVADEPGREFVEEASGQNVFHKLALGQRSAVDRYG